MRTTHHRVALAVLATGVSLLTWATTGCTVGRYYNGVPLRGDPGALVEGQSTKHEVLRLFGPPTQILPQANGEAFVYTYDRANSSTLRLQDPITGINWFTYSREFEARDRLLVIFDVTGVVRSVAVEHHIGELPRL